MCNIRERQARGSLACSVFGWQAWLAGCLRGKLGLDVCALAGQSHTENEANRSKPHNLDQQREKGVDEIGVVEV